MRTIKDKNLLIFQTLWCCTICWFTLTGNAWITDFHFKTSQLTTFLLFLFSIIFLFTKNKKVFYIVLSLVFFEWFTLLPETPNHRWIFFLASIFVFKDLNKKSLSHSLMYLASIIYFFAFLAKLNTDFLFSEYSCSIVFFEHVKAFIKLPNINHKLLAFSIALTELTISILLLARRTRKIAIFIGLGLHLGLALDIIKHFLDFSSVMSIFLVSEIILNNTRDIKIRSINITANFFGIFFTYIFFNALLYKPNYPHFLLQLTVFWLLYYLLIYILFFSLKLKLDSSKFKINFFSFLILALTCLNGLSPYLGIKTRSSFSMYSNLWIDNTGSNHMIFSKSLDIFDFLKNDIEITNSNNYRFSSYGKKNLRLPYFELLKATQQDPFLKINFKYKNNTYDFPKEGLPKDYININYWLTRKLLIFQPSSKEVAQECIW